MSYHPPFLIEGEGLVTRKGIFVQKMRLAKPMKRSIADIEATGSVLGFDENNVQEIYYVSKSSGLKQHVTRSFLLFLFSLLAVVVIAFILGRIIQLNGPPYYGGPM
jgi:hypothetical protein